MLFELAIPHYMMQYCLNIRSATSRRASELSRVRGAMRDPLSFVRDGRLASIYLAFAASILDEVVMNLLVQTHGRLHQYSDAKRACQRLQ